MITTTRKTTIPAILAQIEKQTSGAKWLSQRPPGGYNEQYWNGVEGGLKSLYTAITGDLLTVVAIRPEGWEEAS